MDNNQMCNCKRCNGIVHEIKRGDTLYNLSRLYNVPVGNILRENKGINPYNLMIGEKVCIPIRMDFTPYSPNRREISETIENEMNNNINNNMKNSMNDNDMEYHNYGMKDNDEMYDMKNEDYEYEMKDKYIHNQRNVGYDVEYRTSEFDSISLKELVMNKEMSVSEFANILKNYL